MELVKKNNSKPEEGVSFLLLLESKGPNNIYNILRIKAKEDN